MGGRHGFGAVVVEENEPVFHARWEGRVFGLRAVAKAQGMRALDESRHAVERLDPADYLNLGYYGRWLRTFESQLIEDKWMSPGEVEAWLAGDPLDPVPVPASPRPVAGGARREIDTVPRFLVGQQIRTRNHQPPGHTRLPGYARARRGVIAIVHPSAWVLPDSNAHRRGENPQPVYSVRFAADELWGSSAEPGTFVHVDLFESYLESEGEDEQ